MALPSMTGAASLNPAGTIGSLWDGLSPHLVASIYEVDHKGNRIGDVVLKTAFSDDTNLELSLNWQSPFESAGPESKAPALMAMIQSGALQPILESGAKVVEVAIGNGAADKMRGASIAVDEARGRTGITKLNSTQVFSGMPPVKITAQLLLRAWRDPEVEVEQPLDQLMVWALPKRLAPEGTMLTAAIDVAMIGYETYKGERSIENAASDALNAALPSESPTMLAISYKGRTYAPLVIESVGVPLGSPVDKLGRFVQLILPVTFSTLTAIDGADWKAQRRLL